MDSSEFASNVMDVLDEQDKDVEEESFFEEQEQASDSMDLDDPAAETIEVSFDSEDDEDNDPSDVSDAAAGEQEDDSMPQIVNIMPLEEAQSIHEGQGTINGQKIVGTTSQVQEVPVSYSSTKVGNEGNSTETSETNIIVLRKVATSAMKIAPSDLNSKETQNAKSLKLISPKPDNAGKKSTTFDEQILPTLLSDVQTSVCSMVRTDQNGVLHYHCNFCCYATNENSAILAHLGKHSFCCKECSFKSYTLNGLTTHMKNKHAEDIPTVMQLEGKDIWQVGKLVRKGILEIQGVIDKMETKSDFPQIDPKQKKNVRKKGAVDSVMQVKEGKEGCHNIMELEVINTGVTQTSDNMWECGYCLVNFHTLGYTIDHILYRHSGQKVLVRRNSPTDPMDAETSAIENNFDILQATWACLYCGCENKSCNEALAHCKNQHTTCPAHIICRFHESAFASRSVKQQENAETSNSQKLKMETRKSKSKYDDIISQMREANAVGNSYISEAKAMRKMLESQQHSGRENLDSEKEDSETQSMPSIEEQLHSLGNESYDESQQVGIVTEHPHWLEEEGIGAVIKQEPSSPPMAAEEQEELDTFPATQGLTEDDHGLVQGMVTVPGVRDTDGQQYIPVAIPGQGVQLIKLPPTTVLQPSDPSKANIFTTTPSISQKPQATLQKSRSTSSPKQLAPKVKTSNGGKAPEQLVHFWRNAKSGFVTCAHCVIKYQGPDAVARMKNHAKIHKQCKICISAMKGPHFLKDPLTGSVTCLYCSRSMNGQNAISHMNEHVRIHTGEKVWGCPYCHYEGNKKHNMILHLKTHHRNCRQALIRKVPYNNPAYSDKSAVDIIMGDQPDQCYKPTARKHTSRTKNAASKIVARSKKMAFRNYASLDLDARQSCKPILTLPDGSEAALKEPRINLRKLPVDPSAVLEAKQADELFKHQNKTKDLKKGPDKFECIHCKVRARSEMDMKCHILDVHPQEELAAEDLRNAKLKCRRRLYMCWKRSCEFYTNVKEALYVHIDRNPTHFTHLDLLGKMTVYRKKNPVLENDIKEEIEDEMYNLGPPDKKPKLDEKGHQKRRTQMVDLSLDLKAQAALDHVLISCSHCNQKVRGPWKMKRHLVERHEGSTPMALDMAARIKKKSSRILFCTDMDCRFMTYKKEIFLLHDCSTYKAKLQAHEKKRKEEVLQAISQARKNYTAEPEKERREPSVAKNPRGDETYCCKYCNFSRHSLPEIREHLKTMHKGKPPQAVDVYQRHLKRRSTVFICCSPGCVFWCRLPEKWIQHSESCLGEVPVLSSGKISDLQPDGEETEANAPKETGPVYQCSYCNLLSTGEANMRQHVLVSHASMQGGYTEIRTDVDSNGSVVMNVSGAEPATGADTEVIETVSPSTSTEAVSQPLVNLPNGAMIDSDGNVVMNIGGKMARIDREGNLVFEIGDLGTGAPVQIKQEPKETTTLYGIETQPIAESTGEASQEILESANETAQEVILTNTEGSQETTESTEEASQVILAGSESDTAMLDDEVPRTVL